MSEIAIFKSADFGNVRVILRNGEPWFVAKDVCGILEIEKYRDAVSRLDEDERGSEIVDTPGGLQQMAVISESGLYALIFRSRKPEAKAFARWVRKEVLPAIRTTGGYGIPATSGVHELGRTISALSDRLARIEARNDRLLNRIEADYHLVQKGRIFERDPNCLDVSETCHFLRQRFGIEIGRKRLFKILRSLGLVHKCKGKKYKPTQKGLANGLKEDWRKYRSGTPYCTTIFTRRGLTRVIELLADMQIQKGFAGIIITGVPLELELN